MTRVSWQLAGEILQIVGACSLAGALVEGFGYWNFETPAVIGIVIFLIGWLFRRRQTI